MSLARLHAAEQKFRALVAVHAPAAFLGRYARSEVTVAEEEHTEQLAFVQREFAGAPAGSLCHDPVAQRLLRDLVSRLRVVEDALRDPHPIAGRMALQQAESAIERGALALLKLSAAGCGAEQDPTRLTALLQYATTGIVLADFRRKLQMVRPDGLPAPERDIGEAIYQTYGLRAPWLGRESAAIAALGQPTVPFESAALSTAREWAVHLVGATGEQLGRFRLLAAVAAIESKMPASMRDLSPERLRARVEAYAWFPDALRAVEDAERAYAATLGRRGEVSAVSRAPIEDVAALAAFHRVQNHADPFQMYEEAMAATGGTGAAKVGRAIEIALSRRFADVFTTETRSAAGEVVHRPLGWGLDRRVREGLMAAHAAGDVRSFLEQLALQLDERDAEFSRADVAATKLADLDLLAEGIAGIRPIATGESTEPPMWSVLAEPNLMFAFQEGGAGEHPVLNADGDIIGWHILVDRHPHNQTRAPMIGAARRVTEEASWIPSTLDEAAAFAPLRMAAGR